MPPPPAGRETDAGQRATPERRLLIAKWPGSRRPAIARTLHAGNCDSSRRRTHPVLRQPCATKLPSSVVHCSTIRNSDRRQGPARADPLRRPMPGRPLSDDACARRITASPPRLEVGGGEVRDGEGGALRGGTKVVGCGWAWIPSASGHPSDRSVHFLGQLSCTSTLFRFISLLPHRTSPPNYASPPRGFPTPATGYRLHGPASAPACVGGRTHMRRCGSEKKLSSESVAPSLSAHACGATVVL